MWHIGIFIWLIAFLIKIICGLLEKQLDIYVLYVLWLLFVTGNVINITVIYSNYT